MFQPYIEYAVILSNKFKHFNSHFELVVQFCLNTSQFYRF